MRVLVSGSHGLIGTALVERLEELNHNVVRLVRNKPEPGEILWDATTAAVDVERLEGYDAVVHLGGVSLGEKRWTSREKERIWDSRVVSTEFLARRLTEVVDRPSVYVVASGIGYYGEGGEEVLTENSPKGSGFLAELVDTWEDAASPARDAGIRTVHLRSGVVLSHRGGALHKQLPLFRLGIGGRLGTGTQWLSWISLHDEVEAIIFAITHAEVKGPINVCSPNPVTNADFTTTLGKILNRPTFIPVWRWMLDFAFGKELTNEMLLISQRGKPSALLALGFTFRYPTLVSALKATLEDEAEERRRRQEIKAAALEEAAEATERKPRRWRSGRT